jgi:hypothetical protein
MNQAIQIVGVNESLGNYAVPQMQGTTRYIYDAQPGAAAANASYTWFQGVSSRAFPVTNLNQNRFEVGESLAVQGIQIFSLAGFAAADNSTAIAVPGAFPCTAVLNLYIGNQRVIKNVELGVFTLQQIGKSVAAGANGVNLILETPIIIPPQVEFYVQAQISTNVAATARLYCALWGTGTLLNPKETF